MQLTEVQKPVPGDNELLIRVYAVSINDWDFGKMDGNSLFNRLFSGFSKPKHKILGSDISGRVEAIGKNVNHFKVGDAVFGDLSGRWGGLAEYCCAGEKALALKPAGMNWEEAASIPQAGMLAVQGLIDKGKIKDGYDILINGAGGGVGTFGVQLAKLYHIEVTGVDHTDKLELLLSRSFDHVIDYTREDFTKTDRRYDMIYDLVGNHSFSERRQILTPNGICVLAGVGGAGIHPESWGRMLGNFKNAFQSKFTSQKFVFYIAKLTNDDLNVLREQMQSGKVAPVIDRTYKISETQDAVRYLEEGHARGKVVITAE